MIPLERNHPLTSKGAPGEDLPSSAMETH